MVSITGNLGITFWLLMHIQVSSFSFSFMRHVCNTPVVRVSSIQMSLLQGPAEEESGMDMLERLLLGNNTTEVDPFTLKVLFRLARSEMNLELLTAQQGRQTAEQVVKTVLQEVKYLDEILPILSATESIATTNVIESTSNPVKTPDNPYNTLVEVSESLDNSKVLPDEQFIYVYSHENFDFELLKIVIENANFDGRRMLRRRKAQLRIIYLVLWSFGLDLSELRQLSKKDLENAIRDQKIQSPKRNKCHFMRQDESLGFVLKTLEIEMKLFFMHYDYAFLGISLKNPKRLTQGNYFQKLPNNDLQNILSKHNIPFNTKDSYALSWRCIKKAYDDYLSNM